MYVAGSKINDDDGDDDDIIGCNKIIIIQ